ncbi:MAG: alpha/beta fold hydrolase [Pirellulaceae bacterium]
MRSSVREVTPWSSMLLTLSLVWACCGFAQTHADEPNLEIEGVDLEHGYVDSSGVKIHYVTAGEGPLVVMIHGFPDFWYTWREQIPAIAKSHKVVAIDTRGYNLSDKPQGVANYAMPKLVGDVKAVIEHFEQEQAVIVGHDWGGMISWTFAMQFPKMTERLIILNLPHPSGLSRELATNKKQEAASQYARDFQKPEAASQMSAAGLAFWVKDPEARKTYVEAFERSDMEGLLNYYKANYPRPPYQAQTEFPKVKCPVLMIHGLEDTALLSTGLNGNWDYVDNEFTLVTVPGASHFVQQDAADLVTKKMVGWLQMTATN